MFVFCNPCARAELHQQKRARKLCSATLKDDTLPIDSIDSSILYCKRIEIVQVYPSTGHKYATLFQNGGDLHWGVIYKIPHLS